VLLPEPPLREAKTRTFMGNAPGLLQAEAEPFH
jgi:hypothetical protein